MKKLEDLDKESKSKIVERVNNASERIGIDSFHGPIGNNNLEDKYGICNSCKEFQFAKSEFRIVIARCNDFDIFLHSSNPIKECTNYDKKGTLPLHLMLDIAIIIEPAKNETGF